MFLLFVLLLSLLSSLFSEENIEDYSLSDAILIDNYISYTRMGTPCYYLIYKFSDNSIKEFKVDAEKYYKFTEQNEEGS